MSICSFSGSLVPCVHGAEGVSEALVPRGLCFVVPCLPSWGRAGWAPGTVSPCTAELFLCIFRVISALVNHAGCLASGGCQGMTCPRAVSLGRVTMPLEWWECPVGKEEVGMNRVKSMQCGVPR